MTSQAGTLCYCGDRGYTRHQASNTLCPRTRSTLCVGCDHAHAEHAFFPNGEPAPLCVARTFRYGDTDTQCECEGYTPGQAGQPTCDYTADGTDDGPACGKLAVYADRSPDRDYVDHYCAEHRP